MNVATIRKGALKMGDDIEIRDNDSRFIVLKRANLKELIKRLNRYKQGESDSKDG